MTALLVSVRSAEEAEAACAGGAAVIDVKEPAHGSLGRAGPMTLAAVVRQVTGRRLVSAAWGELLDDAAPPTVRGLAYVKWGLAGCADLADWQTRLADGGRLAARTTGCRLVAVAYADWRRAQAPPPEAVCDFACRRACGAFLVDTCVKDGTTLLDWIDPSPLRQLRRTCGELGVPIALAGALGPAEIRRLADLRPEWFAVRSAACRGGERGGAIDPSAVEALVKLVARTGEG